ncbi:54S ribosomal protein L37, mitochondrial [Neolecta irregularis DAH-3]|uniref:Large ribosomal subunit protein mL54 n=1 Tax=Neolecta irregularis (strain DAH-3) TaxID=1198029 RepID=A0A1U7LP81_NEOID|nr:54S ribosomal protein L37, mitochondrial [Neolecta irregularis DAH-3]|eukprot:OLL24331.1 54S ribosomal protein L37, mitochondrial [Neolecta irregularis DAH-3]
MTAVGPFAHLLQIIPRINVPSGIRNRLYSASRTFEASSLIPTSSCPEGTILKGLNILKLGSDPVALPESEYPSWLWTISNGGKRIDPKKSDSPVVNHEHWKTREFQRKQNKDSIKLSNLLSNTK